MTRRALPSLLTGVLALLALVVPVGAARATLPTHARLLSTTPADRATVETASRVTLTFSEDVKAAFVQLRVVGPRGSETDGAPTTDRGTVTQTLVADLPAGEHAVTFRVVSVDGHPVSGSFVFTTTRGPATSPPSATPSTSASATPTVVASPGPSPSPVPTSTSSEGVPGWLVPAVLAIIAVLVVVPALLLARRTAPPDDEGS